MWGYFKENQLSRHDTMEYYSKALILMSAFLVCYYFGFVQGNLLFVLLASTIGPCVRAAFCSGLRNPELTPRVVCHQCHA